MPDYVGSPIGPRSWSELSPIRFKQTGRAKAVCLDPVPVRNPVLEAVLAGARVEVRLLKRRPSE